MPLGPRARKALDTVRSVLAIGQLVAVLLDDEPDMTDADLIRALDAELNPPGVWEAITDAIIRIAVPLVRAGIIGSPRRSAP